jgi:broad specificity phosphatase PhoE
MSELLPPDLAASLVFVRHGETTWIAKGRFQGQRDPRLTELGRAQAAAAARRLANPAAPPPLPIPPGETVAVWHSPLQRAKATALPIAAATAARAAPLAGLMELSQGEWEGRTRRTVIRRGPGLDAWIADPVRNAAPGGETVEAARPRVREALATILSELGSGGAPTREVVPWGIVVSHGGTMKLALLLLLDIPLAHFWDFPFDPGAISIVELANGRAQLRVHNLTDHLAAAAATPAAATDRTGAL